MKINRHLPQITAVCATAIILIYVLSVPIGVADGGGQYKLLESLGLNYIAAPSSDYFATQFGIYKDAQVSDTHCAIVSFAIGGKENVLDISSVAIVYCILFLIGLWLAVKSAIRNDKMNWVAAALCVFVFADIGYTAYFNTLYSEGAILTTYLIAISLILLCHKKKSAPIYILIPAIIASLAFSFCGTLQAWVGIVFGIVIARLSILCDKKLNKYISIIGGLFVIIMSIAFATTYKPVDYDKNIFHSVFLGTAKYASVAELGLDEKLDELKGSFYSDGLVEEYNLKQEFYSKINYVKITKFYVTHLGAFVNELNVSVKNAYTLRPSYLGNFIQGSNKDNKLSNGFSIFSTLKGKFVPNTIAFTLIFFILYLGVLVYIYITEKEKRHIAEVMIAIGLSAATCLKLPAILTGDYEIGRALFTFNIMFDSMIILAVTTGARYMTERRKNLQSKYGANQ